MPACVASFPPLLLRCTSGGGAKPARVNLGNPNMVASNASFGRITSAGDPRVIQLALWYRF